MIVIGIDPGSRVTGYGIIQLNGSAYRCIDCGTIRPPARLDILDRFVIVVEGFEKLIESHQPDELSLETQYIHKNPRSGLALAQLRGALIVSAKRKNLAVAEYAPSQAKRAIVGNGHASKAQVQQMAKRLLHLSGDLEEDAADALSLSICHAHHSRKNQCMPT